ncbi:MAG: hypothetical protein II349_05875 [Akkermansia sp.]|nr:hypothetical protein [Akkermansia sp.]
MKKALAMVVLTALASVAPALADQAAMQAAMNRWQQRLSEYEAARSVAQTDEQRAAIAEPDGSDVAAALWKSICTKPGERDEMVEPSAEERMRGAKAELRKVATYAFEETWAAPAVFWFINRPQQLARLFEGKPRQLSFYADALLKSVDKRHYSSPLIADSCAKLAESPSVRVYKILEKAYTRNQDSTARGCAALAMSIMLTNPTIAAAEGSETVARGKRIFFLKQALNLTPEKARFGHSTVSEVATELAYVMRNLSVGSIPPQIKVRDMGGKTHTLPTPGKPMLLFFWSVDEEVGRGMVAKGESLKRQYPGLEFCPITVHQDAESWSARLQELGISHCYMDNAENSGGMAYRVRQLPTAVLIDERCHILYIGYPDMKLQTALMAHFNDNVASGPRVRIGESAPGETAAEPVIQPGSQPTPAAPAPTQQPQPSDEAPALREMPQF